MQHKETFNRTAWRRGLPFAPFEDPAGEDQWGSASAPPRQTLQQIIVDCQEGFRIDQGGLIFAELGSESAIEKIPEYIRTVPAASFNPSCNSLWIPAFIGKSAGNTAIKANRGSICDSVMPQ
jgi:hypothetical protein